VQSANHTLLVDTAYGAKHYEGDTLTLHGGELLNNLKRAGLEPDDIDLVFYTHFHSDHVGWTSRILDNQVTLTFPKARFLTRRTEWQRFDDPAASRWGLKEALALLAKRIELVENGEQLFPGASVLAAPGHTQGHSALVLTSGKERAIIMGDVFHSALQFEHPEWTNTFDNDPEQAKLTRKKMLQELAQPFTIGIGAHLSTSVFGRLALIQENYQWQVIQLS
jgi:glyoxylase-like metal-dependent hydrolase (beta-lactamase superfamily II)